MLIDGDDRAVRPLGEHTHECRECGSTITHDDDPCAWDGGNVDCWCVCRGHMSGYAEVTYCPGKCADYEEES
jgi:hypothetical protein